MVVLDEEVKEFQMRLEGILKELTEENEICGEPKIVITNKENSKAVRAFERLSPEELRPLMGETRPVEVKG
jgi:hypothetical protein